jgi:hypothetical protein
MRTFSAREHEWQRELDGIELAGFWPRASAFVLDWLMILILLTVVAVLAGIAYNAVAHLRKRLRTKPPTRPSTPALSNTAAACGCPCITRYTNAPSTVRRAMRPDPKLKIA